MNGLTPAKHRADGPVDAFTEKTKPTPLGRHRDWDRPLSVGLPIPSISEENEK